MSFEDLLKLSAEVREVEIDEQTFYLTSMSGANRDTLDRMREKSPKETRQFVVACCLCDGEGQRYDPLGLKKAELSKIPTVYLDELLEVAVKVSGLVEEDG